MTTGKGLGKVCVLWSIDVRWSFGLGGATDFLFFIFYFCFTLAFPCLDLLCARSHIFLSPSSRVLEWVLLYLLFKQH